MTTATTTEAPRLSAINPLIAYDSWDEDTAANVRAALSFIAESLINSGNVISQEATEGAGRLILCCVAAMEVTK